MNTKFRVWDKSTNQYLDSEYFRITGQGTVDNYINEKEGDSNCVIEQFTGALDKNSKEIYHGDILLINSKKAKRYENGEVIWSNEYCAWLVKIWVDKNKIDSDYWSYWLYDMNTELFEAEIVGNIHEHSHLLKT